MYESGVGEKRANTFFFNQGPASFKIFIHYFSLSASRIYLGIEELTSNTTRKINPLCLRCSLFDEKQQRIQPCFPSQDTRKKRVQNHTDGSQNTQRFLKQVDITSYSQNHNNLVVLPGSSILHLFSVQTDCKHVRQCAVPAQHPKICVLADLQGQTCCSVRNTLDSSLDRTYQRLNTWTFEIENISVPHAGLISNKCFCGLIVFF